MKVLITGYKGFIGNALFEFLSQRCIDVVGIGRGDAFPQESFTDIVHCASLTPLRKRESESPDDFIHDNLLYTMNLLRSVKSVRMIFLSSVKVYGTHADNSASENSSPIIHSVYGLTKLLAEKIIQTHLPNAICLRLPGILGRKKDVILIPRFIESAREKSIVNIYNRNNLFNVVYDVGDLVALLFALLKREWKGHYVFCVATDNPIPIKKIPSIIREEMDCSFVVNESTSDQQGSTLDNSALKRFLGYSELPDTEKTIRTFIRKMAYEKL